jgi:DnaK suppressor protein
MDDETARALLEAERARVEDLLRSSRVASGEDRSAQESEIATSDAAEPLAAEGVDQAVTASLVRRLDAVHRAVARLEQGTYGRSVRSGEPIPDERLEADPAAELTIEEARADAARR